MPIDIVWISVIDARTSARARAFMYSEVVVAAVCQLASQQGSSGALGESQWGGRRVPAVWLWLQATARCQAVLGVEMLIHLSAR